MSASAAVTEKRRELLVGLLALLIASTRETLHDNVDRLVAGTLTAAAFGEAMLVTLTGAHAHAGYLGRQLAGSTEAYGAHDELFGQVVASQQKEYAAGFVADLDGDRYRDADGAYRPGPIKQRASLYALRLRGTANEAWALALPPDTVVLWIMSDEPEEHCEDCPKRAEIRRFTAATLPGYPGDGSTACLVNCWCSLITEDGRRCFDERTEA